MAKPDKPAEKVARRRAYHHGDLRNALVEAATELVREGGPEALVLREVARATGVSSTAAYRHFENHRDLFEEVKNHALGMMTERVRANLDAGTPCADRADEALRCIRASGQGYVDFALAEPGLFRLIFRSTTRAGVDQHAEAPAEAMEATDGPAGVRDPSYTVMSDALDELVATGALSPELRPFTDIALWASVHGVATLLIDTSLARLPRQARDAVIDRSFALAFAGLEGFAKAPEAPEAPEAGDAGEAGEAGGTPGPPSRETAPSAPPDAFAAPATSLPSPPGPSAGPREHGRPRSG
ncbi:TetR/AcrR family transcriptional regulator [Yinghuangia sp. ASG 101]|uniref:TetR/AcrR family transcriptional regulator n=1 Tax=Yinghuangia sp. ASG 101 TaxID=2896848 RepID=UPI001E37E402|nr:TetR/AcrR family transcriptional regulator [Yinghuangia sp. ASG 101]UGQ09203.1 TetR/AcrR family transcriptional regulator [Yinghuangia sp. ASG 101]